MDKYAEPPEVTQELFNRLDVDGVITTEDIITAYKSISLLPPPSEVKKMFQDLGTTFINYEQFRQMRSSIHRCEINALSEFKKYESRKLAKGMVTIDNELYRYRIDSQISEEIVQSFIICDKNKDGIVTYRDVYDYMMGRIPHDWLKWLVANLERNIPEETIEQIAIDNGLNPSAVYKFIATYKDALKIQVEISQTPDSEIME